MRVAVHRKEYVRARVNLYLDPFNSFSHAKHAYRLLWSKWRVIHLNPLLRKKQREKEIEAEKDEVAEKNMERVVEPPADVRLIPPFNLF
jgi:hypothetical protein